MHDHHAGADLLSGARRVQRPQGYHQISAAPDKRAVYARKLPLRYQQDEILAGAGEHGHHHARVAGHRHHLRVAGRLCHRPDPQQAFPRLLQRACYADGHPVHRLPAPADRTGHAPWHLRLHLGLYPDPVGVEHAVCDVFVRGWIGTSKEYTDGVIHFAPSVSEKNITLFEKAFDTLEMFKNNGARKNTVVRGLGRAWEQPFSDLIKEVDLMAENISSVTPIEFTGKSQKEKVKEITDKLEQGIKDLFNSDRYKEYLSAMSKFHNYSFRNTILILMQKPDASYIAGFNTWKNEFKRAVRKGEKGIKILAPAPYKKEIEETAHDKNGNPILNADGSNRTTTKTITVPAFKITTVFDLSQTDGKEIPTIANQLTGNVEDYEKFFRALKEISPVPVELEDIDRAANGYYHLTEKRIAVRNDLSEMQTIKTAIHEIAHAKLHALPEKEENEVIEDDRPDNRTREVQAESIAYTVCQHFGIDTSDYSFGYVAGWSSGKETAELKASLEVIRTTADEMITDISEKLKELEKVQENDIDGKDTKQADKAKNTSKKLSIRKQLKEGKAKTGKAPKKPAKSKKKEDISL